MPRPPVTPTFSLMPRATRYPVPAARTAVEQVILRSRFLCTVGRAETPEAAHAFVREVREEWPDAGHHATAWVAGSPGSTTRIGMSDDGEPHGTAGRPMLHVLLHCGVGEVVAVVSRWFGGTKLGTGGLARAYAGSVELALASLPTVERIESATLEVTFGYDRLDAMQRLLPRFEAEVLEASYLARVQFTLRLPIEVRDALIAAATDLAHGDIVIHHRREASP